EKGTRSCRGGFETRPRAPERKRAMRRRLIGRMVVTFFAVLGMNAAAYGTSVEEQFDQINRLSDKARAEALEKEARKEGEVVWYAAMASDRASELIKAFEGKYPFLKVRFQPGGASRQIELLMVE